MESPLGTSLLTPEQSKRITVEEIARRLGVGEQTVYRMLEARQIPAIRVGKRWIIRRYAYEHWERTCGTPC